MTATVDDIGAAFEAALATDAGTSPPPEIPAPPRKPERDPAAPHGRTEDGSALAPYGLKSDGTPRLKPAGPGRPKGDDKPRVTTATSRSDTVAAKAGGGADYTQDLMGLGTSVWLGASSIRGGKLGPVKVPDLRPYAAAWHAQLPVMAAAWNTAAQQNETVRGYVEKFTGDGSMTWVIGVAVASAGFVAGCIELAKAPAEVRGRAAAANDARMQEYVGRMVEEMGLAEAA
jgi:hypothetical protein